MLLNRVVRERTTGRRYNLAMPDIQAILFDFGKVLSLSPDPEAWSRLRELTGSTEEALQESYWRFRDDYDAGAFTGDVYWQQVAGRSLPEDTLRALKETDVALWTQMNQPMLDWVDALHRTGFRTGILSNMPDAMAEGICARFDWIENFDHAIWSHALKLRKPQAPIYQAAIDGLGVAPEHILFIDDKEENTAAAIAAGMQAIVYLDHDSFVQEMHQRGYGALLNPSAKSLS